MGECDYLNWNSNLYVVVVVVVRPEIVVICYDDAIDISLRLILVEVFEPFQRNLLVRRNYEQKFVAAVFRVPRENKIFILIEKNKIYILIEKS